jgi:hypothetical protein
MRLAGHVTCMRNKRSVYSYRDFEEKPGRKKKKKELETSIFR